MDDVDTLLFDQVSGWLDAALIAVPRIGTSLAVILLTALVVWFARNVIRRLGRRAGLRRNLLNVLVMLANTGLWLTGLLIALTIVFPSITPGRALATLGLGSVAIGFAFKDTLENFLAGILILLREPFALGDFIECESAEGKVESITIRDTHIRQTDGQLVVVPNATLFHNPVTVRTDQDVRRATLICGVSYGEDVDRARDVIEKAVRSVDMVREDVRDIEVFAKAFGASSVDFEITWWTGSTPLDIRASRDQVVTAVKRALDEAEIEIPFPYRTLTVNEPVPIRILSDAAS